MMEKGIIRRMVINAHARRIEHMNMAVPWSVFTHPDEGSTIVVDVKPTYDGLIMTNVAGPMKFFISPPVA